MAINSTTTILFGNGLGMALDPDHFRLKTGLSKAWKQLSNDAQERLICSLNEEKKMLETEDDYSIFYSTNFILN